MFEGLFFAIGSNVLVCSVIAMAAILVGKTKLSPSIQYALWIVVLAKLVTPPIITLPCIPNFFPIDSQTSLTIERELHVSGLLSEQQRELDAIETTQASEATHQPNLTVQGSGTSEQQAFSSPSPGIEHPIKTFGSIGLFVVWLSGGILFFKRRHDQSRKLNKLLASDRAVDEFGTSNRVDRISKKMGLAVAPETVILDCCLPPFVWSNWKTACLVLPKSLLQQLNSSQKNTLIAHEIAHLKARHHWGRSFETFVGTLWWWCPIFWLASYRLRDSEEQICDAWVVNHFPDDTESYANSLLATLSFLSSKPSLNVGPSAMGANQFSRLSARIQNILLENAKPKLTLTGKLIIVFVLLLTAPISFALSNPAIASAPSQAPTKSSQEVIETQSNSSKASDVRQTIIWTQGDFNSRTSSRRFVVTVNKDGTRSFNIQDSADWLGKRFSGHSAESGVALLGDRMARILEELDLNVLALIDESKSNVDEWLSDMSSQELSALAGFDFRAHLNKLAVKAPRSLTLFAETVDVQSIVKNEIGDRPRLSRVPSEEVVQRSTREAERLLAKEYRELISLHAKARQELLRSIQIEFVGCPDVIADAFLALDITELLNKQRESAHGVTSQLFSEFQISKLVKSALKPVQLAVTDQLAKLIQKHNTAVNAGRFDDANALVNEAERISRSHFITRTMVETSAVIENYLAED